MEELTGAFSLRAARLGVFEVMNGFRCIGEQFSPHCRFPGSTFSRIAVRDVVHHAFGPDAKPNPRDDQRVTREVHHSSIDRAKWTTEKLDKQFSRVRDKFENIEVFQDWSEDDAPPFFSVYNHTEEMDCGHRAASG